MSKSVKHDAEDERWEQSSRSVPSTWAQVDFRAAFDPVSVNDKKVPAKAYLSEGKLPVVDQGQTFIGGYTNELSLTIDPGDGLIVFGDHTRAFKRIDFAFAAGADGIKVLRPTLSDSRYAYYACLSLKFPNKGYSRHYSFLSRCKFPIAPEREQSRIVSKIEELFSRIEEGEHALQQVQKLTERYRQSVLKAAVTGELTREWREKHKGKLESGEALRQRILKARREAWEKAELDKMKAKNQKPANDNWKKKYRDPFPPDTTDLPELPEGWVWVSMDAITNDFITGPFGSSLHKADYVIGGIPLVNPINLRGGLISPDSAVTVNADTAKKLSRYLLQVGDIVLARRGEMGRCAPVTEAEAGWMCGTGSAILRCTEAVLPTYGALAISSGYSRAFLEANCAGTTMHNLNQDAMSRLPIPVPDIEHQQAVLERLRQQLTSAEAFFADCEAELTRSRALRQAILREAFVGHLVPQDSADEPASTLLERIAAERDALTITKPKRGFKKRTSA